ncbi:MAG: hypothetical protein IKT81_01455, partial [Clostridia bacterium]|nr:hypothetical protein [Clostridia bacterium]
RHNALLVANPVDRWGSVIFLASAICADVFSFVRLQSVKKEVCFFFCHLMPPVLRVLSKIEEKK